MMPECFEGIKDKLGDKLINFGFLNRADYLKCLLDADIAISTAGHEFYGVSMYVQLPRLLVNLTIIVSVLQA